jgi:hypothetical protein
VDEPITDLEQLEAAAAVLAREPGTPADFEAAMTSLAGRIVPALSHRGVICLARLGATSFHGARDVPSTEPPEFQGRLWDDLPPVPLRSDGGGPRREPDPGESLASYLSELGEELFGRLGLGEEDSSTPAGLAVAGYVSVLAVPELRRHIGWERSLDAHALGMLTAERALSHLGESRLTPEQEEVCFRWLHEATYADVPADHLAEAAARRAVRVAHQREPAGAVAVMTCEVPVPDALAFHEQVSAVSTATLDRDRLLSWLDRAAAGGDPERGGEARREGFGTIGRLDLTPAASAEGPRYAAFVHGHLMRWLIEEQMPFRSHLLGLTTAYASLIVRILVTKPAAGKPAPDPVTAHVRAIMTTRMDQRVPLCDELALLAWLMDQRGIGFRLEPFLSERARIIAQVAAQRDAQRDREP